MHCRGCFVLVKTFGGLVEDVFDNDFLSNVTFLVVETQHAILSLSPLLIVDDE